MSVGLDGRNHKQLVRLADEYRSACEAVKPAWNAMVATPPRSPDRAPARSAYYDACRIAKATRNALLDHVRGDAWEGAE